MKNDTGHFFEYSRDPVSDIWSAGKHQTRGLSKFTDSEVGKFIKKIQNKSGIGKISFRSEMQRIKDHPGGLYITQHFLSMKLKGRRNVEIAGIGVNSDRYLSHVTSLAELLERLATVLKNRVEQHRNSEKIEKYFQIKPKSQSSSFRTSNGVAFQFDPVKVLKNAFCEVLERDAFLTCWYSDEKLPRIELKKGNVLSSRASKLDKEGWTIVPIVIQHDIAPVYCATLAIVRKVPLKNSWNFFIGGACDQDLEKAIRKAFEEAATSKYLVSKEYENVDTHSKLRRKDINSIVGRLFAFQRPEYIKAFLEKTKKTRFRLNKSKKLSDEMLVKQFMNQIQNVRVFQLIVPTFLARDVYCVKVVSEALQDIDWKATPEYNSQRIAKRYGTQKRNFNRWPHPFV